MEPKEGGTQRSPRKKIWEEKTEEVEEARKPEVHRLKAKIPLTDGKVKIVQGVREIFEMLDAPGQDAVDTEGGKIVLIGRNLTELDFEKSLLSSIE